jgi:hypothetical protein
MAKIVIVAKNYQQYRDCLVANCLKERDTVFADSIDKIRGLRNAVVLKWGEWGDSPLFENPSAYDYLKRIREDYSPSSTMEEPDWHFDE